MTDRLDGEAIRRDRRRRLFAAMADHDLDALVLGRPGEVAFATGARQLWLSGSRPFGPACVAVRATGRTHLLSVSDYDVPGEVGHDDLYGLSWDPAGLLASLAAIPGLVGAARIGTTSSTPGFPRFLAAVAPGAEVVDGTPALAAARTPKSVDEVTRISAACASAATALDALTAALAPGVTERRLQATYLERLALLGVPTPPSEGVVCATPTSGSVALRRIGGDRPIEAGQLVVLDPGAFHLGYEGGVGRTWVCPGAPVTDGQQALARRCRAGLEAVASACRAGSTGEDLLAAWLATGERLPAEPLAVGIGMGVEPPLVGAGVGASSVLVDGSVLALTSWVAEEGVGGFLERDLVVVTETGPRYLTHHERGPAAGGQRHG